MLAWLVDKVPSALVSTTVTKAFGLTARLPLVPAAINRFVLPPTHKKTVLLIETELVCGTYSMLQSPPLSLVIMPACSPTATYKPPANVTSQSRSREESYCICQA